MDLRSKFRWYRATPLRIGGLILLIVSMPLRAFSDIRGYQCAFLTLTFFFSAAFKLIPNHLSITTYAEQLRDLAFGMFLGVPGLINPLILFYLFVKPARRVLVLTLFGVLLVDAGCVFLFLHTAPAIGFYLWAAGIILIVTPPYKPEQVDANDASSDPVVLRLS